MEDSNEIKLHIALGMMRSVDHRLMQRMLDVGLGVDEFFSLDSLAVSDSLGLNSKSFISDAERSQVLAAAEKEYAFVKKHNIKVYSILDDNYPWMLSNISDPPKILFQLGDAQLNGEHVVSVVGTRRCTGYGADFTNKFVEDLGGYFPDLKVVSGLAHGIDSFAHKAALDRKLSTVAVVAHGLDMIYPVQNRELARRILNQGGCILSEYVSGDKPYAGRFLERNRIVAGLSQFTMVVESEIKGGAMSTANYAFHYDREVGALPGRITDPISAGCNLLIRKQKATLIGAAADVIEIMGWKPAGKKVEPRQRNLFPELDGVSGMIYDVLRSSAEPVNVDFIKSRIRCAGIAEIMSALTDLEFDGIVSRRPGNRYAIS